MVAETNLNHFIEIKVRLTFIREIKQQSGRVCFPGMALNSIAIKPDLAIVVRCRKMVFLFIRTFDELLTQR